MALPISDQNAWTTALNHFRMASLGMAGQHMLQGIPSSVTAAPTKVLSVLSTMEHGVGHSVGTSA